MKKLLNIFLFSLSISLLLASFISYADQISMSNYYPSSSGTYTKLLLKNSGQGISENGNTAFCQQTGTNPVAYSAPGTAGVTFINAGKIFADPTTGFLQVCKTDGSVASYPGGCFNRFGPSGTTPSCPTNYTVANSSTQTISYTAGNNIVSWSCCLGNGAAGVSTPPISKSGCFSIYSPSGGGTPAACSTVDPNAYDVSCETVSSSDTTISYKRNCCFNYSSGSPLGSISSCSCTPINGTCSSWSTCNGTTQNCLTAATQPSCGGIQAVGTSQTCTCTPTTACSATLNCSSDSCGTSCGTCSGATACSSTTAGTPGTCTTSCTPVDGTCATWKPCPIGCAGNTNCITLGTPPSCGGSSPVGVIVACSGGTLNGTCMAWGPCNAACGPGVQTCLSSTIPCGGSTATGTTQACTGTTSVDSTCTAWGACSNGAACGSIKKCTAITPAGCGGDTFYAVGSTAPCGPAPGPCIVSGGNPSEGIGHGTDSCGTCTFFSGLAPTCFVAGTKILLDNGKEKPIEQLKVGDVLLGSGNTHNKIVKFDIMPKKDHLIYAFNGGRYFVTANHIFKTTTGWKAIDPAVALQENPQLKIEKLNTNDELITLTGTLRIKTIDSKIFKDSIVYNPELDNNSNHEYYADGFLVHNKILGWCTDNRFPCGTPPNCTAYTTGTCSCSGQVLDSCGVCGGSGNCTTEGYCDNYASSANGAESCSCSGNRTPTPVCGVCGGSTDCNMI